MLSDVEMQGGGSAGDMTYDVARAKAARNRVLCGMIMMVVSIIMLVTAVILFVAAKSEDASPPASPPSAPSSLPSKPDKSRSIDIIHFNDVYQISPVNVGKKPNVQRLGGLARLARYIKNVKKDNPERTLALFAGDLISPSALSGEFKGKQMIDVMNSVDVDAACLGNHEFDFGLDVLNDRLSESQFPWLNTNLQRNGSKNTNRLIEHTTPTKIIDMPFLTSNKEKATARVCIFGLAYDVRKSITKDTEQIGYLDAMATAKATIKTLRSTNKCTIVIVLTHMDGVDDCALAKQLSGAGSVDGLDGIDLVLGGHDHETAYVTNCGPAPYIKADSDLKTMWKLELTLADDGSLFGKVDARNLVMDSGFDSEEAVALKVSKYDAEMKERLGEQLGCSKVDLDAVKVNVRQKETNVGNFFTDALRDFYKTDVAVWNGGGIRSNRVTPSGNLTKQEIVNLHPFGNTVVKIQPTGKQLREFLETSLSCYSEQCGDFNQISGAKYTFSPKLPSGSRLTNLTKPDGHPFEDNQKYSLALSDYQYYQSFKGAVLYKMDLLSDALPAIETINDAVKAAGTACIKPVVEGRIINADL